MRKEIIGIFLFFLVVFSLISLLSFSPMDPSVNHARATGPIHNLFGLVGAHLAGLLIFLFGLGAFWIPVLLLFLSIHFFGDQPGRAALLIISGGVLLVVATGSLFTFRQDHYLIFGSKFSSGGIIGILIKAFLVKYVNLTGSIFILTLVWVVGFILTTGFSLVRFAGRTWQLIIVIADRVRTLLVKWNERRKKAQKRAKVKKEQTVQAEREIKITAPATKPIKEAPAPKQEVFEFMRVSSGFQVPSSNLLDNPDNRKDATDTENLRMQSKLLEKKLDDFGVNGKVVTVTPGPVITTFEYEPAPGVKINKIVNLSDDLSLALRAASIRIVAPIPGKAVIGIEIPNSVRETVRFKEVIVSNVFEKSKSKLPLCLGKDIVGNPVVAELDKMPHLLIAGATGSGKSVALNAMICSFLYRSTPDQVRLIMIDPKRIELSSYDGIPHLITPVVTDVKKATNALFWAVKEMEKRYELLSLKNTRHINQYNQKIEKELQGAQDDELQKLPFIVIVIDELADLMMVASRDVEVALTRLAQMARAAGIHLILATQRPSVDVLTGIIKANFPTRLTFQVSSKTDSRTIIDANGAESLLGNGDMLFMPPGTAKLQRIHGAFISEAEIARITEFLKKQQRPEYDTSITQARIEEQALSETADYDEKYDEAVALVTKTRQASISMVQRHLRIGYNRAARIIEMMEKEGIVGPSDGAKPREVLARGYEDVP
ncbi:MAG: DNA translocase FtsK 4TM domain-containing protein [Desulfobacterales bacterium]|nr:DNA translocase FtsK 4TM domain-containing protein [Desulfobacterales bacterium]